MIIGKDENNEITISCDNFNLLTKKISFSNFTLIAAVCVLATMKIMWRKTVNGPGATIAIWKQFFH